MNKKNRYLMARKQTRLTQSEVAQLMGLNASAVSKWECNRTIPDQLLLPKIADLYNVSIDYLLGRENESQLFENARVGQPEIMKLFNRMSELQQIELVSYARGMLARAASSMSDTQIQNTYNKDFGA